MRKLFGLLVGCVVALSSTVALATDCHVREVRQVRRIVDYDYEPVRRVQRVVRLVEVPEYEYVYAPRVVERLEVRNVQKQKVREVQKQRVQRQRVQRVKEVEVQKVQKVKEVQKVRRGFFNRNKKIVVREEVVH